MGLFTKHNEGLHFTFGQPPEGCEVFWRVEAKRYSVVIDADADTFGVTDPRLEATWWKVKRHTPKGVRLQCGEFINSTWHKKWANATLDAAMNSFVARKKAQIRILEGKLSQAKAELALVETSNYLK